MHCEADQPRYTDEKATGAHLPRMQSASSFPLSELIEKLTFCTTLEDITRSVTAAARQITGSDGATFVFRDREFCYYADEDAISPLWKGKRFPAQTCVSGWCMVHQEVVVVRDIYQDERIPIDAYRPTFVKSLCMVPIRERDPLGALGCYWSKVHEPTPEQIRLLQIVANSVALTLENIQLKERLDRQAGPQQDPAEQQLLIEAMIQSLSHDLKGPLSTMVGYAEVLDQSPSIQNSPQSKRYTSSILRSGRRLGRQIDRVLALYRMNHPSLRKERVDIAVMAHELVEDVRSRLSHRVIELEVEPRLWANADPELLFIALENLISNAVKFTAKASVAKIQVGKKQTGAGKWEFYVQDNGVGFDPAESMRLFRPLVRLHSEREFQGTGLGLASTARILALHQGSIRAEGSPQGGATFYFTLPES
jgi:signal transduction histidine kinase